ncbi:MAG: aminopeptidase [Candidatus Woesearchaeota archaeon]|jgi:aminopeptidase
MDNKLKLAKLLVEHSIRPKKGETGILRFGELGSSLAIIVYELLVKKGCHVILKPQMNGFAKAFLTNATDKQLTKSPKLAIAEAQEADFFIGIGAEQSLTELNDIDPKKIADSAKALRKAQNIIIEKDRWVICQYPTNAYAKGAGMSQKAFEKFAYTAMCADLTGMYKTQQKLKKILDKANTVRIVGKETDVTFSIKGRLTRISYGRHNIPDGEVFIAPVENTTEGQVLYDIPTRYGGSDFKNIRLTFEKGQVVKATSDINQKKLLTILSTDKGARFLGEFGIGTNYAIKKPIKQILFDEKIGGTIHLAVGQAYSYGGGKNKSAVHWDMIKEMRKFGEVYVDGKLIQKNGKFTL